MHVAGKSRTWVTVDSFVRVRMVPQQVKRGRENEVSTLTNCMHYDVPTNLFGLNNFCEKSKTLLPHHVHSNHTVQQLRVFATFLGVVRLNTETLLQHCKW